MNRSTLVLASMVLTSCVASVGQKFDTDYVDRIVVGTTKADVVQNLGNPPTRSVNEGSEVWTYQYTRSLGTPIGLGSHAEMTRVMITFKGDRVTKCQYTESKSNVTNPFDLLGAASPQAVSRPCGTK